MGEIRSLPAAQRALPAARRALPAARRALFVDDRGTGLRATWHAEQDLMVLSLWRQDRCVGTFRMPVAEVGRLAGFLVAHLGELAAGTTPAQRPSAAPAE